MTRPRKTPTGLRSFRWFGKDDLRSSTHRSRARQQGFTADDMAGKPIIAILNTWSDINPCNLNLRDLAEEVRTGVLEAGGVPFEMPLMSLSENIVMPTSSSCERGSIRFPWNLLTLARTAGRVCQSAGAKGARM